MALQQRSPITEPPDTAPWFVYMVRTARGALYTGVTTDVARRARQHERGVGAKSLRGKAPLELVYHAEVRNQGLALRLEARIKQLRKRAKEHIVSGQPCPGELCRLLLGAATEGDDEPRDASAATSAS